MALINKIEIIQVERKMWTDRNAYVFSDTGIWKYNYEHWNEPEFNSSWRNDDDYLDNVRSDFLNEVGEDGGGIYDTELFEKITDEELEKFLDLTR